MMQIIEFILHIDIHLRAIVEAYSAFTYFMLFGIIFLETGIVVTPFLPGDSLLFSAGALAATGSLNIVLVFIVIFCAAVLGDTLNYHIGKYIGPKIFTRESSWLFRKQHLIRAQQFYTKYGKKTIILARFIPIIRTFAPFVAGIGTMSYGVFLCYNIIGALIWSALFVFGGFLFGNISWVQEHFGLLIIAIIITSFIPVIKELICHLITKHKNDP